MDNKNMQNCNKQQETITNQIKQIASIVVLWTLLSRIFGYIRDMLMAQLLGSGALIEIFQIALSIPNLFRSLLGEGAMHAALLPKYTRIFEQHGHKKAAQFFGDVMLFISAIMFLICVISYWFMPQIVSVLAWGFHDSSKLVLTTELARLCLPFLPCTIIVSLLSSIVNHHGKFAIPSALPIILNLFMIIVLLFGVINNKQFDVRLLSYALVFAGLSQLVLCITLAWWIGVLPNFSHRFNCKAMHSFIYLLMPGLITGLSLQLNFVINRALASTLMDGSIAWLFFAERLFQLPLALIGISLSIVLLPMLSKAVNISDVQRIESLTKESFFAAIFWSLPAAVGLALCAEALIRVLFERGAFLASDTRHTTLALQMLAFGLPAYVLVKVIQPLFFAKHDTKTPMITSISATVFNILLSLLFMPLFNHFGLALATALSGWLQALFLYRQLNNYRPVLSEIAAFIKAIIIACILMAGSIILLRWGILYMMPILALSQSLILLITVIAAVVVYLIIASWLSGYNWRYIFTHSTSK